MQEAAKKPVLQEPGKEEIMDHQPVYDNNKRGSGKLKDKVVIITGGDSGIGKAIALSFAKEGAEIAIVFLNEDEDADNTAKEVKEKYGKELLLCPLDISLEENCKKIIDQTVEKFGRVDVLINNAAVQFPKNSVEEITEEQLLQTFRVNIFSQFFLVKYALPHMKQGSAIINTASLTAYEGNAALIDYSATKGAIVSYTRSLSKSLSGRGIRVNAVAPGPVWTPLIISSFGKEASKDFGKDTMYQRAAEPVEIAPSYVFLACDDSIFISGQVLHPNGGHIING